ncbi:MAG: hypothetical protein HDS59_05175 [Barnesiella sp.]|nr:hypothetical protein [Barnesiella sp.]
MSNRDIFVLAIRGFIYAILLLVFLAAMCCSCISTKYVPVETVRTEYKDNIHETHSTDSVTDTRFVFVKGDTVIDYRDRVRWIERIVRDSIFIERTDSITVPYPVEKSLTRWQQIKMDYGGIAISFVFGILLGVVIWRFRKLLLVFARRFI